MSPSSRDLVTRAKSVLQREASAIEALMEQLEGERLEEVLAQMSDAILHVVTEGEIDPYGMIATGSSLVNGAAGDVLCVLLLEKRGYSRDDFGMTHPGGAVGEKLKEAAQ